MAALTLASAMPEPLPLTETANPRSRAIDRASTEEVLALINSEDARVAAAVRAEIPRIAKALDADRRAQWTRGGRLFYCRSRDQREARRT